MVVGGFGVDDCSIEFHDVWVRTFESTKVFRETLLDEMYHDVSFVEFSMVVILRIITFVDAGL